MNINIKNCEVNIITGTDTLEINGGAQTAENAKPMNPEESGFISEMTYSVSAFMANRDKVKIGDRVKLPSFTVPVVKMDGDEVMEFDKKNIKADDAIVIGKDENGNFILIFDHCLFESAIDLNHEKHFEMTQLGQYLKSEFLRAMNGAGIPAESCGLISRNEMFGNNALEYFKTGRNRIAVDFDENCNRSYRLSTLYDKKESAPRFCLASTNGVSGWNCAPSANFLVRPRFVISAMKKE
ncbi:hypothetical protein [Treponema succinifaciens]|uniref:hypothetical protein n=1 Tax=Treponema succinifaciens TaxID=167 RepID=UPI003FCE8FF7